ncbi:DUF1289 domain-containing protein [Oceanospirillaceae bacterium]|nr:DUF1289 domain-containing protein [Oceanospirillaceae bacterium]
MRKNVMRRRARPVRNIDHTIPSPCVKVCQFKKDELVCKGCYRSQDEVRNWMIMSKDDKLKSLAQVALRQAAEKN